MQEKKRGAQSKTPRCYLMEVVNFDKKQTLDFFMDEIDRVKAFYRQKGFFFHKVYYYLDSRGKRFADLYFYQEKSLNS